MTCLHESLQEQLRLTEPDGVLQGDTSRGTTDYYSRRSPVGDPSHHCYFHVSALETMLNVAPGADLDEVLPAMTWPVVRKGELAGTYAQEVRPPK